MKKIFFTLFLGFVLGSPIQTFAQFDLSNGATFNAVVNNPFDVSGQDSTPEAITFSPDGTRMYLIGSQTDGVIQYNLSIPFNITSAAYGNFLGIGIQDANPRGVAFSADGMNMFMIGENAISTVYHYNLSTAFNISTAAYSGTTLNVQLDAANPRNITFSPNGLRMYITNSGVNKIVQYNLSTAFDITTATFSTNFTGVNTQDSSPQGVFISPDGLRMFYMGASNKEVYQYTLSTAFELSTAAYASILYNVNPEDTNPKDVTFSADGTRMYVIGGTGIDINQYDLTMYYSRQTGNWNNTNTWSSTCGGASGIGVPPVGANVVICNGHTVTLTADATCKNLTVNSGGTLKPDAFNLTVSQNTQVNGTFLDDGIGGTSTFTGTFTVNSGGSFTAAAGGMNYFVFRGNITNNGTGNIDIGANTDYTFNPVGASLTITANGTGNTWFGRNGGGTKAGHIAASKNLIVAAGSSNVDLYGDDANGLEILTGATVTNQKPAVGNHLQTNLLRGAGTFVNTNATLIYEGIARPMATGGGTFTFGTNDFVGYYRGGSQDVASGTYNNIRFANGGTKTLLGNITVNGILDIWNGSTLDVSTTNYSIDFKGTAFGLTGAGSNLNPRAGTFTFSGTVSQTLQNDVTGANTNFYNLIINNSAGMPTVSLTGAGNGPSVSNTLTLTAGRIVLGTDNLAYGGTEINLTRASGYIETNSTGTFIRSTAGSNFTFPVGNSTQYQPVVLGTSVINASVRFGTPTATVPASGVGSWFVNNASTASTVRFNNPQGGSLLTNVSAINKYGSSWVAMSGTTYPTATDYSVSNVFAGSTVEFGISTSNAFITTWTTIGVNSLIIPTFGGGYNYNVTWTNLTNPGTNEGSASSLTGNYNITPLQNSATYQIVITGTFPRIYFNNVATDKDRILTIEQWGNIAWASMERAFHGCSALTYNATDVPNLTAVTDARNMFNGASSMVGNASMGSWNVSNIQFMDYMFANATVFNANISAWNVGNVRSFEAMFLQADAFNQPIGSWSLGTVNNINMYNMFFGANVFNQPLNAWNVQKVTNMNDMFRGAVAFNQPLNSWNTSAVTNMAGLFMGSAFNQPIGSWNTSAVTNMAQMFNNNAAFNQDLSAWNTANVTNVTWMFFNATSFNQSLASWNVANVAAGQAASMLDACGMNTANYDATLIGWAPQAVKTGVVLGANGRTYCTAFGARATLISKGWTFSADALSGSCPSFSAVTATNVTATSFRANWTADAGADNYKIELSTNNFATSTIIPLGNVGNYTATSLLSNTIYYYRVLSYNGLTLLNTSNTKITSTYILAGSGSMLNFNSSGQYVNIGASPTLFSGSNSYTFETWINVSTLAARGIAQQDANNNQMRVSLDITATGTLRFSTEKFTATPFHTIETTSPVITANQWYHVAFVSNTATTKQIYVNGVLQTTNASGTPDNTATQSNKFWEVGKSFLGGTMGITSQNGRIDELRIWNTARTEAQIRASMCSKLIGNESGLVVYLPFDDSASGITENKALYATFDNWIANVPALQTSSAPLGDVSANTYTIASGVTLTNTDVMQASNITGSPTGVHLYKVNVTPNTVTPPSNYQSLYTDRYWGMFFVGGTAPQATLTYNYSTNSIVDVANALRFAQRDNNADNTWSSMGGVQNRLARRLTHTETNAGEYILAERNAIISNYKDGGTVLTFNGTSGYVNMPRYVQDNFTIEFWLRTTQTGTGTAGQWETGTGLVTANVAGTNDFGITLIGNKVSCGTGTSANTLTSTVTVNDGKWYHVAISRIKSTGALALYINGKLETSITGANTNIDLDGASNIHIGKLLTGTNFFIGSIDELRIWNTALTEITIKDWVNLRANDAHPNFTSLEAYYRFDENAGTLTEDLVNGNDASLLGGVTWADANMPLGDGAVSRVVVPATSGAISVFPQSGVTMNFGAITPNGEVVVTRIDGEPESYPAIAGNFMNCYWVVRNYGTNLTFSPLPEIKFEIPAGNTISPTDLANPNNIKLYKRPDDAIGSTIGVGNWQAVAQATGFGSVRCTQNAFGGSPTGIEEFSQFVLFSPSSALPITLLGLKGRRVEGLGGEMTEEVKLEWSTGSEINNKGFEVETSQDGLTYQKIAFVEGKGNSTSLNSYHVSFINSLDGYYRLKQVDFGGTFSYSPVVFVGGMVGKDFVIVYPNPTETDLKLKVSASILPTDILKVEVYDVAGKRVWRGAGKLSEIESSLQQTFRSWKAGIYLLQIQTNKKKLQTKIVKE